MDKQKNKWISSRLKDKKKELGIEDKVEPPSTPVVKEFKQVSKPTRNTDYNSEKKRSNKKSSYSPDSGKKETYERNSWNRKKHVIRISNLPSDITNKELFDLVYVWGEIGNINVKTYHDSVSSYIDFYNENEANYFIEALNSTPFDNLIIKVEMMNFT
jgi:hypothetical protein